MEESGTKLHIPLVLKHFVLFPQKLSVCGRVYIYLFSCVLVWLGRVWLFGSGEVELSGISLDGGLLLHPALFVLVFGVCVVFNLLSVLIPVWMVTHRNIATTIKGE